MTEQESKIWDKFWGNVAKGNYNSLTSAESSIMRKVHQRRILATFGHSGAGFTNTLTLDGVTFSSGFQRLVIGDHGPYIEMDSIGILTQPKLGQEWRIMSRTAKYEWHIPLHLREVKIYRQLNPVGYADYRVGMFYVCPYELFNVTPIDIEPNQSAIPDYALLV